MDRGPRNRNLSFVQEFIIIGMSSYMCMCVALKYGKPRITLKNRYIPKKPRGINF